VDVATKPGEMLGKLILYLLVALGLAMSIPKTRAMMVERTAPLTNNLKARLVPARLRAMSEQLSIRVGRAEGFPSDFEGWLRRDFSSAPEDPWGHFYYLKVGRREFTVGSMGPDALPGTADDITVKRTLPK